MRRIKAKQSDNGICLYSKQNKKLFAIATLDENENVTVEWTNVQDYEVVRNFQEKMQDCILTSFLIVLLLITIFMIFVKFGASNYTIFFSAIAYFVILFMGHVIVMTFEKILNKNKQKFRAATNMLLNAYEELTRVPSIGEIRNFSMFKSSCRCFNFWQRLKIIEPTDKELMVAIACMETYIANE